MYRVWFNHKVERLPGVDNEKPPYESLEKLNSGEAPKGIKTGFWELDMLTGGFIGSKLRVKFWSSGANSIIGLKRVTD